MNEPNNLIWLHISFFISTISPRVTICSNVFDLQRPNMTIVLCYSKVRMLNRKYSSVARYSK